MEHVMFTTRSALSLPIYPVHISDNPQSSSWPGSGAARGRTVPATAVRPSCTQIRPSVLPSTLGPSSRPPAISASLCPTTLGAVTLINFNL